MEVGQTWYDTQARARVKLIHKGGGKLWRAELLELGYAYVNTTRQLVAADCHITVDEAHLRRPLTTLTERQIRDTWFWNMSVMYGTPLMPQLESIGHRLVDSMIDQLRASEDMLMPASAPVLKSWRDVPMVDTDGATVITAGELYDKLDHSEEANKLVRVAMMASRISFEWSPWRDCVVDGKPGEYRSAYNWALVEARVKAARQGGTHDRGWPKS